MKNDKVKQYIDIFKKKERSYQGLPGAQLEEGAPSPDGEEVDPDSEFPAGAGSEVFGLQSAT